MKNNKGITLIALVITIIVMLILVAVTIRVARNGNLFAHAGNAVKETKKAAEEENEILDARTIETIVAAQTGEAGESGETSTGEKFSSIYSQDANYTDTNGKTARIPKGFAVGTSSGINTVAGGLVITDSVTADGSSNGNEFVWIPVDNISNFVRTEWENNNVTTLGNEYTETEDAAYLAMKASVEQWKGFYIARFEAGTTTARVDGGTNSQSDTVYSKKLLYPYNLIYWSSAQSLSTGMYTGNGHGVTSTLCYGVQWDSVMRFIKDTNNVSDSTTWGNYEYNEFEYEGKYYDSIEAYEWQTSETKTKARGSKILLQTGASNTNKAKNIYDLAGNAWEWTNETTTSNQAVVRGGYNGYSGEFAAERGKRDKTYSVGNGVRI